MSEQPCCEQTPRDQAPCDQAPRDQAPRDQATHPQPSTGVGEAAAPPVSRPLEPRVVAAVWQRPRAVLLLWAARLLAALLVALPVTESLAGAVAGFPDGDRRLFQPGGFYLVEVLRVERHGALAAARTSAFLALAMACALLPVVGAVLVALHEPARVPLGRWAERTTRVLPRLCVVGGATLVGQVVAAAPLIAVAAKLRPSLEERFSEPVVDLSVWSLWLLALLSATVVGVGRDLAWAALVRDECGVVRALRCAASALRRRPWRLALGWLGPLAGSVGAVALAAPLATRLRVEEPQAWRLGVLLLLHQAVALVVAAARVAWLRRASVLGEP